MPLTTYGLLRHFCFPLKIKVYLYKTMAGKIKNNIVVIGGGTGSFMVLSALRGYNVHLTAIVTMADDGGSTGILRDQYGVLPPGDVRRALVALSLSSQTLRELFNYRFSAGDFSGHNFGNMLLTALEKITGDFGVAVREAGEILNIQGKVLPITLDNVRLHAELADGKIIHGETKIDIPKNKTRSEITSVWLKPEGRLNPDAAVAIKNADLIIIGPGDLYTSIVPNLLVRGMADAIKRSRAKKVYVANIMTKAGETNGMNGKDFVSAIEKYLGEKVLDYAVFNKKKPSPSILKKYGREGARFVAPPAGKSQKPKYILADLIDNGPFLRHAPRKKLARILMSLA